MTKCLDQQIQKLWVQMSFTTWSEDTEELCKFSKRTTERLWRINSAVNLHWQYNIQP